MTQEPDSPKLGDFTENSPTPKFPTEPFACPACGQMLAASCRVCVACQHVIDPEEIVTGAPAPTAPQAEETKPSSVPYPWRYFFVILAISFLLTEAFLKLWGIEKAQLAMGGVQALASIWVSWDALHRRIPHPLRWFVGSLFLPIIIFPWYLARRRAPEAICPFVEAKVGPVTRFLFIALMAFLLLSAVSYLMHWPHAK